MCRRRERRRDREIKKIEREMKREREGGVEKNNETLVLYFYPYMESGQ